MRDSKDKSAVERPQFSVDPPQLAAAEPQSEQKDKQSDPPSRPHLFDCACHLSSRQFDGVANSVLRRAVDAGTCVHELWTIASTSARRTR